MNKIDVLSRLTPQMRAVLDKQDELTAGSPASAAGDVDAIRASYARERAFWNEGGPGMAQTVDTTAPGGPFGSVKIRIYSPSAEGSLPAIVYIHGGGYLMGSVDTHDRICRVLAAETGAAVVSVDYRLSPEARFPSAIQECAAAVEYLRAHGADHHIDGGDLALAGDSAGASLALGTYLYLRDELSGAGGIRALLLYYGMYGLTDSASRRLFGGPWDGLTREDLEAYSAMYIRSAEDLRSPYIDCLSADLAAGVPPCYIVSAELDPLRDDSHALAAVLAELGIPHRLEEFNGVLHAFLHYGRMLAEATQALSRSAAFYAAQGSAVLPRR
ncbi:acetyl esterase [Arthrobacter mobilis]|uniref:Acetyl esterase n=1 Tax=Arthrobacter mobilis TaxID=2724944 RepID=A0A7X6K7J7_9MICC|nr:acetyl esterase [Arthrobacter mobilis]NKX56610.1 acetyl esterase [Arthrobacter mobilis]